LVHKFPFPVDTTPPPTYLGSHNIETLWDETLKLSKKNKIVFLPIWRQRHKLSGAQINISVRHGKNKYDNNVWGRMKPETSHTLNLFRLPLLAADTMMWVSALWRTGDGLSEIFFFFWGEHEPEEKMFFFEANKTDRRLRWSTATRSRPGTNTLKRFGQI